MEFLATEHFVYRYRLLLKKRKQYGCIDQNFRDQFADAGNETLWNMGYQLFLKGMFRSAKVRIKSCSGHGDSSGFRVISLVNKETNRYYFLDIYPKTGKYAQASFDKQELKEFLIERKEEEEAGTLFSVEFDFEEELVHMVQKKLVSK